MGETLGKLAFVFPGQGAQKVGMGRDLYNQDAEARQRFEEANDALGFDLARLCFEGPEERLNETEFTQPAVLTASVLWLERLRREGYEADVVAGLSLGEYSALVAAGVISFWDAVRLVRHRGRLMQEAVPLGEGGMLAVLGLDRETVENICSEVSQTGRGTVEGANYNCPGQIVVGGAASALPEATERFLAAGASRVIPLPVSAPFHTSMLTPAAREFEQVLADVSLQDAHVPVVANVHAEPITRADEIRQSLVKQMDHPVLWEDCVRRMYADEVKVFVEVGPGNALTGFLRRIERSAKGFPIQDFPSLDKFLAGIKEVC